MTRIRIESVSGWRSVRKEYPSVKGDAVTLRINHCVLGRWIDRGRIRAINIGDGPRKILRIEPDEIELYLKKHTVLPSKASGCESR